MGYLVREVVVIPASMCDSASIINLPFLPGIIQISVSISYFKHPIYHSNDILNSRNRGSVGSRSTFEFVVLLLSQTTTKQHKFE